MLQNGPEKFAIVDVRTNKTLVTSKSKEIVEEIYHTAWKLPYDLGCYKIIKETKNGEI